MKMKSSSSGSRALALVVCISLLGACASLGPQREAATASRVTSDNQAGIWVAGLTLYGRGHYLAAANLFEMANRLKPARRISQNIGMAYFKAAQVSEHPEVLRLEYLRRAIPYLKSYRVWLANDYGRKRDITAALAETDQRIAAAEQQEKDLSASVDPISRIADATPPSSR